MVLDMRLKGHRFDSWPFHFQATSLGTLIIHTCLLSVVTKKHNLVPVKGQLGRQYATDLSGLSTYRLSGLKKEDEQPTYTTF